jgi:carboxylate-amine ligase
MAAEPEFTFGIEEEYFLVDPKTMALAPDPDQGIFRLAEVKAKDIGGAISRELIRAQIEVATPVCRTQDEAGRAIRAMRKAVVDAAEAHGLSLMACSAHPFSYADDQRRTDRRRYREIKADLQFAARRLMVCGMHVHIGIDDVETRLKVLNAFREYLPLLLALTASSPFWEGEISGLKSVRPVILDELPRSGIPDRFPNYGMYARAVESLVKAGVIEDASKIWWDARLSARVPTLEVRMMDVCPRIEDGLAIAAFIRCMCRMLWREVTSGPAKKPTVSRLVIMENRWRAQRFGVGGTLIYDHGTLIPIADWVAELADQIKEDARHFGCEAEIARIVATARHGTSADRQLDHYQASVARGDSTERSLKLLAETIVQETRTSLQPEQQSGVPS